MMTAIKTRNATLFDYGCLTDFFLRNNSQHCGFRQDYYREVDSIITKVDFASLWFAQWATARNLHHWPVLKDLGLEEGNEFCVKIAKMGGKSVGAIFADAADGALGNKEIERKIDNIFVLPEFRKKGVGSALVAQAEQWAKGSGHEGLYVKISSQNDISQQFYAANGFKQTHVVLGKPMSGDTSQSLIATAIPRNIEDGSISVQLNGCSGQVFTFTSKSRSDLGWSKYEKEIVIGSLGFSQELEKAAKEKLSMAEEYGAQNEHHYMNVKVSVDDQDQIDFLESSGFQQTDVIVRKTLD